MNFASWNSFSILIALQILGGLFSKSIPFDLSQYLSHTLWIYFQSTSFFSSHLSSPNKILKVSGRFWPSLFPRLLLQLTLLEDDIISLSNVEPQ